MTQQGDFALSRDWKDLAQEQDVQYVLTGTMLRQEGGVLVNARVVGMQTAYRCSNSARLLAGRPYWS